MTAEQWRRYESRQRGTTSQDDVTFQLRGRQRTEVLFNRRPTFEWRHQGAFDVEGAVRLNYEWKIYVKSIWHKNAIFLHGTYDFNFTLDLQLMKPIWAFRLDMAKSYS